MTTTATDDTTTLIEQIKTLAVVRERVTLSSGRQADYYVDMRRVSLDGYAAPIIGRVMRDLVADWDFDGGRWSDPGGGPGGHGDAARRGGRRRAAGRLRGAQG